MNKRIFIIHGWGGHPEDDWFPWLKRELEGKGFEVYVPQLPQPEKPEIDKWISKISEAVGSPDERTYFLGHSMGCQAIARYLEAPPDGAMVGGAVFVAGFFKGLTNIGEGAEEKEVEREWLDTPIDLSKVKSHLKKSIAVFSDNDPFVPLENQEDFKEKLGSEIIAEHQMGHFSTSDDKLLELPVALSSLLKIIG